MVKRLWLILALCSASLALAGCGEGKNAETTEAAETTAAAKPPAERLKGFQPLKVTLDGEPGPETAGLLMAKDLEYFDEVGLDVSTYAPLGPERPVEYVEDGTVDVAVTHEPQLVLAREEGEPVVALGSLVSGPTLSLISLPEAGIRDVADLKGKTVIIPGAPFQKDFLEALLEKSGLTLDDVELKQNAYQLTSALISGRADAIFGGSRSVEGAELESRDLEPVVVEAEEMGLPPYDELVVIARENRVAAEPKLFRVFMAALQRGTAAAIEDPEAALMAISRADETEFHPEPNELGLEVALPLLSEDSRIDEAQTKRLIDWMHREGMIERKLPVSALTAP
ncbi:MAG TPA: ABC transporter substrate-binding protein [Solirubrobacterales bacterium]|nr:ABC transporter substrate-binding protein [Solirubrobacterales bacterium]